MFHHSKGDIADWFNDTIVLSLNTYYSSK
jgi:hypothetical protein